MTKRTTYQIKIIDKKNYHHLTWRFTSPNALAIFCTELISTKTWQFLHISLKLDIGIYLHTELGLKENRLFRRDYSISLFFENKM